MTPARAALLVAERHLIERVHQLDEAGQCSREFVDVAHALAVVVAQLRSDPGELLTTREMAQRLSIAPKTLRRKAQAGEIAKPINLGQNGLGRRGRSVLRWRAQA